MKNLLKIASNLSTKGYTKLAQQVIDLLERKKKLNKRKDHNQRILDQIKEEDRLEEIYRQHQEALEEGGGELKSELYPEFEAAPNERRFAVTVMYPNFDDKGAPYFDETSITETLSMTKAELDHHKWQQEKGYLKIVDVDSDIPSEGVR